MCYGDKVLVMCGISSLCRWRICIKLLGLRWERKRVLLPIQATMNPQTVKWWKNDSSLIFSTKFRHPPLHTVQNWTGSKPSRDQHVFAGFFTLRPSQVRIAENTWKIQLSHSTILHSAQDGGNYSTFLQKIYSFPGALKVSITRAARVTTQHYTLNTNLNWTV